MKIGQIENVKFIYAFNINAMTQKQKKPKPFETNQTKQSGAHQSRNPLEIYSNFKIIALRQNVTLAQQISLDVYLA